MSQASDVIRYYIGVDAGGTKTEAVIGTQTEILSRGLAEGANLHNLPIDLVVENIQSAIKAAIHELHLSRPSLIISRYQALCLGISGLDTNLDKSALVDYLTHLPYFDWPVKFNELRLCNDGFIGLKSGTQNDWGICLICSTGSNCLGINSTFDQASSGDWGYLLGDQGSGFALGLKLIRASIKEFDGRIPQTLLLPKVLKHLKLSTPQSLIGFAYSGRVPVKQIASLTKLYSDPEISNHPYLVSCLSETVAELTSAYLAVINRLQINKSARFPIIMIGGLFTSLPQLLNLVSQSILKICPEVEIVLPKDSPAVGAINVASLTQIEKYSHTSIVTCIKPDITDKMR